VRASAGDPDRFCHACFSGAYPTILPYQTAKDRFEIPT
jgi:hypothetical protein